MKRFTVIVLLIIVLLSCKKEKIIEDFSEKTIVNDNKEIIEKKEVVQNEIDTPVPTNNQVIDTILNSYENNQSLSNLFNMGIKINISPDNNFYFVYSTDCENFYEDPTPIKNSFSLGDINFQAGDTQWWILFDKSVNKIIMKGVDFSMIGNLLWDLKNKYLVFNLGTDLTRTLIFNSFDLKTNQFSIAVVSKESDLYNISPDGKKIAYIYHGDSENDYFEPGIPEANKVWLGIKILDIPSGKQISIKPETDGGQLTIIKWNSDSEIDYIETNYLLNIEKIKKSYSM